MRQWYGTITGAPAENVALFTPPGNIAGRHWCFALHGNNGSPLAFVAGADFGDDVDLLTRAGQVVIAPNLGGDLWGGPTAMALMDDWYAWATGTLELDPVCGILGLSMNGLGTLNWAVRNQSKVDRIVLSAPVTDLDSIYAMYPSTQAEMDAGYGGSYALNGTGYNPIERAADFGWCPITIFHGDDDDTVPVAHSQAFDAATGTNVDLRVIPGGPHLLGDYWSPTLTAALLAPSRLDGGTSELPAALPFPLAS